MRIVLDTGDGERELRVTHEDGATVADLLEEVGLRGVDAVHVDGRRVPSDHTLVEAAIADGARVALLGPRRAAVFAPDRPAVPRLAVVAGVGAGASVSLDRPVVVGRDPGCDLVVRSDTVSARHCRVVVDGDGRVRVTDLGSRNGTSVGGVATSRAGTPVPLGEVVRLGAVALRVEPPAEDDRAGTLDPLRHLTPRGAVPFNRPPRPGPPMPVPPVRPPAPSPDVRAAPPLQLAALLVPALVATVMVVVLGSWRYALFMAVGPLLLLTGSIGGRRRARHESRTAARSQRAEVDRFARDVAVAAALERRRRWELLPSVAEVRRRVELPSTRLWERRADHDDALRLQVGVGADPWEVPVGRPAATTQPGPEEVAVLAGWSRLPRAPVAVDLAGGGVVGIVGERARAADLARSLLLQACTHHGPADLAVAVVADERRWGDWDWVTWLPHTAGGALGRQLAAAGEDGHRLLAALREAGPADGPTLMLVLDAPAHLQGRDAAARALLRGAAGPVAGIVVAATADQLPAVCDTVVEVVGGDGEARVLRPAARTSVDDVLAAGLDARTCRQLARRLAGLEDPEVVDRGGDLPDRVDLLDLLAHDASHADGLVAAWQQSRGRADLRTPLGLGPDGPVWFDLGRDGPHALVGGTTGSGKSELLRTVVAGLAAAYDPDHVTFVLIDYKGGAAFDACADLPHVVGLVTDLDEHLGARALRCLEAELRHRERRLRAAGVGDLADWVRQAPPPAAGRAPAGDAAERREPLPRLVVVVDEFATLRAELPGFVDALVGIAQRGRSLGVHLVLGTQRPAGAVDHNVRANTNLRVALRTTDDHDSTDVVGVADAAAVPVDRPGRGLVRTGPAAPVPVQTALVSGRRPARRRRPVLLTPLHDDGVPAVPGRPGVPGVPGVPGEEGPTDLARLVAAAREAHAITGGQAPRRPWPDPLPPTLHLADLAALPGDAADDGRATPVVPYGLLDDPDEQRQVPTAWQPGRGHLLVHGGVGSGRTSTLATLALAVTARRGPGDLHLHVLDLDRGALSPLAGLPHCGGVVVAREHERRRRLEVWLLAEAERRRRLGSDALEDEPLHLLLVDGLATWLDLLDDPHDLPHQEAVQRLLVEGPRLRMVVVGSTPRPGALRAGVASAFEQHLVHRLADPGDAALLGLRAADVPDLPPGRAVRPSDGGLVQVAHEPDLGAAVRARAAADPPGGPRRRPPAVIGDLPERAVRGRAGAVVVGGGGAWRLPVGLDTSTLAPAGWTLHPGEHALVLGPAGSGRSTLLAALAVGAVQRGIRAVVVAGPHGSAKGPGVPDVETVEAAGLAALLEQAAAATVPTLVLVDDAERAPDPGPALAALGSAAAPVRLVAAARQDDLLGDYGHWLRRLARARCGMLLRPTGDVPGDLLGARVPRRPPAAVRPGRGWLVRAGEAAYVQAYAPPG